MGTHPTCSAPGGTAPLLTRLVLLNMWRPCWCCSADNNAHTCGRRVEVGEHVADGQVLCPLDGGEQHILDGRQQHLAVLIQLHSRIISRGGEESVMQGDAGNEVDTRVQAAASSKVPSVRGERK